MLTRVGIDTKVVAMPSATFFTQATDLKFSFMLLGWSTGTGEASSSLKALLMTYNQRQGLRHREPRPLLEHQGRRADRGRAADRRRRRSARRYLQRATELAINDTGHRPAALPGQPVGDARRHHVRAARRREHARVEVHCRQGASEPAMKRAARRTWPAITTPAAALHRQSLARARGGRRRCR